MIKNLILLLKDHQITLALAESCTGGRISKSITSFSGDSSFFLGSLVCYSNDVKINLLHVKKNTIASFGAVSNETCLEMINGIKKSFNSQAGIAVTGIAGPTGGSKEKPVGTVFIGVFFNDHIEIKKFNFNNKSRKKVQNKAEIEAIKLLYKFIKKNS